MSSEQWKPIGPGHWRQNEDPMLFNRPSLPGRDICDWIPDQPITPEALEAEGWERPVLWWIQPVKPGTPLRDEFVSVELPEAVPAHLRVYVVVDGRQTLFRGVKTMAQLRALVEMLEGE